MNLVSHSEHKSDCVEFGVLLAEKPVNKQPKDPQKSM